MKNASIQQRNSITKINSTPNISLLSFKESFTINFNNQNQKEQLDNILRLIKLETDNNITKVEILIDIFFRKYEKIKNDVMEKILDFLSQNNIHYKAIIKCINGILELTTDNFQIINILNNVIPLLLNNLFQEDNLKNLDAIHDITKFIGKLIKIGNTHIFGLIEEIIDSIFLNVFKINSSESNLLYAYINLLSQIMQNSVTISFNNIIVKNNLGNFITLMEQYCSDKNEKIREISVELTGNFIDMLKNRDNQTKKKYIVFLYETLFNQFNNSNLKINNVYINNFYIVNGFLRNIKKMYELYPLLFNDDSLFVKLADSLMKLKNYGKNEQNIKIEFINFIPDLYKMNPKMFKKRYIKEYLKFSNESLNREKDAKIKYTLLVVLGKLNYYEQESINKYCSVILMPLLTKLLNGKDFLNDQVLKCLSDLLNNKAGLLSQSVILIINIFNILPKIFKTPLNKYKVEFLISLINYFNYYSMENCTIVILSLDTISLFICNEEFRLHNFLTFNEINSTCLISPKLNEMRSTINKDINKYLSDISFKDKNSPGYFEMISSLLTLFANIKNNLFYKDMLVFYHYKLIPLMKYYNRDINQHIINIILCDFVSIDKNDENSSQFIIKNLIDVLINIFISSKENLPKEGLINIFENKKIIIHLLLNEKQNFIKRIFNLVDSSVYDNSKGLLIKVGSILEQNDNGNKTIYKNFIGNYIENLLFEIYETKSKLYEQKLIGFLYYITIYFKHLYFLRLYEKILNISILLILRYEYKDIITIHVLKIVNELLSNENLQGKNIDILNNVLYILAVTYFKESSINDYLSEYMLKIFYLIIKSRNIDINEPIKFDIEDFIAFNRNYLCYNLKKLDIYFEKITKIMKELENVSVIKLIFYHLLNSENENNSLIILKILGLSMTFSFKDLEKLNLNEDETSDETEDKFIIDDEELKLKIYNKYSQSITVINYSRVEACSTNAILSLIEIVRYHNKKDLKIKIIQNLHLIIQSINYNQVYYIDIILPTILKILPQYESKYQNILIQNITLIIKKFNEKSKSYLDEIVFLIYDYIESPYLETVNNLFFLLFENYKVNMRKYYYKLIPKFMSIIKKDIPEKISYLKLLILIAKFFFIVPYIKLLLVDIKILILNTKDLIFFDLLLELLKEIVQKRDIYIYYPLILSTLLKRTEKILKKTYFRRGSRSDNSLKSFAKSYQNTDTNITILNKCFEIIDIMNNRYRHYFLLFLPKLINYCIINGLIDNIDFRQKIKNYINYETEYTFMDVDKFKKKIFLEYCNINCYYAFNSFTIMKANDTFDNTNKIFPELELEKDNDNNLDIQKRMKSIFSKKRLTMRLIKRRQSVIKNDIVIKSFENSNCSLEKDWIEWYRKVNKSIFEQNPSKFIYIYYMITEYYLNMSFDLIPHCFLSVFNNNTDNNRAIIIGNIEKALTNPKTPDYIIISILNLIDFMEKKKSFLSFKRHEDLGEIAYNCKAYAKALYLKAKGYEDDYSIESIDEFIDLYYKLNVSENCIGIIKLIEDKSNPMFENINDYDKKYIWYINMHDYNKALEIINEKISKTTDTKSIKILKNYRNICLYGLCDWETILLEDEIEQKDDENNLIINIDNNKESEILINEQTKDEEKVERKLLLLKSSLALGKWDKLFKYMNELRDIFMKNEGNENSNFEQNNNNEDINIIGKKYDKDSDEYFSFNDLIDKNEFQFLKYNESIFDLNVCATVMNLKKNNINIARKYISNCQQLLIKKMKVLIKESYTRGNDAIIKNQCLQQLELYCNYKQYHFDDKQYLENLKSKFKTLKLNLDKNPDVYIQYLAISSLIYPIEEEYNRYIDLTKSYIKSFQFTQAENILKMIKKFLKIKDNYMEDKNLIFDEKRIKIELCYNKCLFAKGNVDKACQNLKI